MDDVAAKEKQSYHDHERGSGRQDSATQRLIDTGIDHLSKILTAPTLHILTDAIEDHNRIIDGVANDGEQCCYNR